ncbi:MAG: hypothetical protein NT027_18800 [Proteobacteria bacterium]|nr:hypothetical protein [Pseudomonadota bacterium]
MGLLRKIFGISRDKYQLNALVSNRIIDRTWETDFATHIICDLDKTYVETEFESWVKMARIPFERPHEKITVPGASEVLQCLRWSLSDNGSATTGTSIAPRSGLHFVSSSPPQLRSALEGKLMLDNLDWTSDTFKNQTYNLRMARIDLLRHHIAYKTKAILDVMGKAPDGTSFWMIGDNAEYDPFVYESIRLFLNGSMNINDLGEWMAGAKVERRVVAQVLAGHEILPSRGLKVKGVLIRKLAGYPVVQIAGLTDGISLFDNWFQIAWIWLHQGLIHAQDLVSLVRAFHNLHGVPLQHFRFCFESVLKNESFDHNLPLFQALKDIIKWFDSLGVTSKQLVGWTLSFQNPNPQPAINDGFSAAAKKWYESIENSRSSRKDR